ncbi:response regulator transcription factor [Anaerostipes sp. MSJ-23]|uniref:response regulator transcription factor n=2 Tax=unclassified Anaerostipes TaxID=2635253 RepID=UPI001C10D44C|nr:response regulator transcription factor [Anaerostipes sp. MSJ-23]MBU5460727.1 response regulator transcription factor [Anaerostipes sp. MSJ-23]
MKKTNILIIEDHEPIQKELAIFLEKYGYQVTVPQQFDTVVNDCLKEDIDLILLDINLPVFDGYYICREVRNHSDVPIIVVTSRNSEIDELMSMNLGADDFITKPYNTQILLARITALLKRTKKVSEEENIIKCRGLEVFLNRSVALYQGQEIELSKNEMKILYTLIKREGSIVSRDQLMEALWQSNEFIDDNTLTVNINRLRKKLETIGLEKFITTKRGQGYMI